MAVCQRDGINWLSDDLVQDELAKLPKSPHVFYRFEFLVPGLLPQLLRYVTLKISSVQLIIAPGMSPIKGRLLQAMIDNRRPVAIDLIGKIHMW